MFRPLSETFIRRSWYSIFLEMSRRVKKAVVHNNKSALTDQTIQENHVID